MKSEIWIFVSKPLVTSVYWMSAVRPSTSSSRMGCRRTVQTQSERNQPATSATPIAIAAMNRRLRSSMRCAPRLIFPSGFFRLRAVTATKQA